MFAAHRSRTAAPRHFAWLLWFALLLPLAQAAASCHLYSHTDELAGGVDNLAKSKHAAGVHHCDLSLTGSLVHGGALPAALLLIPPSANHAAPHASFDSPWEPAPTLAYQGRAPPFALT